MARCGCASDNCGCTFIGGDGVVISGTGSKSNPYVVEVIPAEASGEGDANGRFSGEIVAYGGAAAPTGWLLCNGAAVSRATYSALFTAIGTAYGAGDGSTTFNVPDLAGRFPIGLSGTYPRGQEGGSNSTTLTEAQLPEHSHTVNHDHPATTSSSNGSHEHDLVKSSSDGSSGTTIRTGAGETATGPGGINVAGAHTHSTDIPAFVGTSGLTGDNDPIDTLPAYTSVNYIVKV